MDENELLGVDPEAESGTEVVVSDEETTGIVLDTTEFAAEIAVLEAKFDILTEKVTGCYCMLLILAVLGLKNVFRSIIRKVMSLRGGTEDV